MREREGWAPEPRGQVDRGLVSTDELPKILREGKGCGQERVGRGIQQREDEMYVVLSVCFLKKKKKQQEVGSSARSGVDG